MLVEVAVMDGGEGCGGGGGAPHLPARGEVLADGGEGDGLGGVGDRHQPPVPAEVREQGGCIPKINGGKMPQFGSKTAKNEEKNLKNMLNFTVMEHFY